MNSLSDYVNVQNGFAFSSSLFTSIGNKIIRIGDIKDGTVEMDKCVSYPTNIVLDNSFKITKGNLLLAMSGATTGKVGLYKSELVAYNNQRVAKIEPKIQMMIILNICISIFYQIYIKTNLPKH